MYSGPTRLSAALSIVFRSENLLKLERRLPVPAVTIKTIKNEELHQPQSPQHKENIARKNFTNFWFGRDIKKFFEEHRP